MAYCWDILDPVSILLCWDILLNLKEHLVRMLMLPYIVVMRSMLIWHILETFWTRFHVVVVVVVVVLRFIKSYIASWADARPFLLGVVFWWHIVVQFYCAFPFTHVQLLLGHQEMSILHVWCQYSFKYDFLHYWVLVILYWNIWLGVFAWFWHLIIATYCKLI